MNTTATALASIICACYEAPPGWNATVVSVLAFICVGLVLLQFVYFGVLVGTHSSLILVVNIVNFYIIYYVLWLIQNMIRWQRPIAATCAASATCANGWFDQALNVYAFPEPILVTSLAFTIFFFFTEWKVYQRGIPIFLLGFILFFVALCLSEIFLRRQLVGQLLLNIAVAILLGLALCTIAHHFFDAFPHLTYERDHARSASQVLRNREEMDEKLAGRHNLHDYCCL